MKGTISEYLHPAVSLSRNNNADWRCTVGAIKDTEGTAPSFVSWPTQEAFRSQDSQGGIGLTSRYMRRQFLAVVNALGASRSVRTFQQFGVDYEWFCDQGDNAPNDADLLACRRLHELALEFKVPRSFYHPAFPEDLPFETRDDLIHHLLANAEELRYLSLEPVGHPRRPDYSHYLPYSARNLRTFFRSGFHFHLRSLHLRGFYVDESFFRDIMLRCCGTLEELHVGDMALWGRHELPTNQKLIDFFEEEINADEVWLETVDGWVSMLCFLRDKLNLADFKLSGMLVEGMLERTLEWNPLSHETEPARVDAPHYSTTRSGIRVSGGPGGRNDAC